MSSDAVRRPNALTLSEQVAEEIRAMLGRKRWSQARLARELGENPAWLNYRLTGRQAIDLNDLQRIADELEVSPVSLFGASVNDRLTTTPNRRRSDRPRDNRPTRTKTTSRGPRDRRPPNNERRPTILRKAA